MPLLHKPKKHLCHGCCVVCCFFFQINDRITISTRQSVCLRTGEVTLPGKYFSRGFSSALAKTTWLFFFFVFFLMIRMEWHDRDREMSFQLVMTLTKTGQDKTSVIEDSKSHLLTESTIGQGTTDRLKHVLWCACDARLVALTTTNETRELYFKQNFGARGLDLRYKITERTNGQFLHNIFSTVNRESLAMLSSQRGFCETSDNYFDCSHSDTPWWMTD